MTRRWAALAVAIALAGATPASSASLLDQTAARLAEGVGTVLAILGLDGGCDPGECGLDGPPGAGDVPIGRRDGGPARPAPGGGLPFLSPDTALHGPDQLTDDAGTRLAF